MKLKVFSKNRKFLSLVETSQGKFIQHVKGYFLEAKTIGRDFFIHYDKINDVWIVSDYLTARRITTAAEYSHVLEAFEKRLATFNLEGLEKLPALNRQ